MREIKFSCMWSDGESWMDLRYTLEDMENGEHWEAMSDMPLLKRFVLKAKRQYTGLLDKNGKEIYEGDILQVGGTKWLADYQYNVNENQEFQEIERLEVVYSGTSFIGKQAKYKDGYPLSTILLHDNDGFLIIGNIYETPELLNEANNE